MRVILYHLSSRQASASGSVVERLLAKEKAAGSIPVSRSLYFFQVTANAVTFLSLQIFIVCHQLIDHGYIVFFYRILQSFHKVRILTGQLSLKQKPRLFMH